MQERTHGGRTKLPAACLRRALASPEVRLLVQILRDAQEARSEVCLEISYPELYTLSCAGLWPFRPFPKVGGATRLSFAVEAGSPILECSAMIDCFRSLCFCTHPAIYEHCTKAQPRLYYRTTHHYHSIVSLASVFRLCCCIYCVSYICCTTAGVYIDLSVSFPLFNCSRLDQSRLNWCSKSSYGR